MIIGFGFEDGNMSSLGLAASHMSREAAEQIMVTHVIDTGR